MTEQQLIKLAPFQILHDNLDGLSDNCKAYRARTGDDVLATALAELYGTLFARIDTALTGGEVESVRAPAEIREVAMEKIAELHGVFQELSESTQQILNIWIEEQLKQQQEPDSQAA